MPKDEYLQPTAADPVLEDNVVLSLVRRHVPDAKVVREVDESGGEARTYAVDQDLILKTQRPHRLRVRTSLKKEVFFLQQLASDPSIHVPHVLGYGQQDGIEYTCMTRIPGVAAVRSNLTGSVREQALTELGKTIRRIHTISQQPFEDSGLFPQDRTFEDLQARLAEQFQGLINKIHSSVRWELSFTPKYIEEIALSALRTTDEKVALHSNPGPTHTFVDPLTGNYSGLIDFGDAYLGHPAFDLYRWGHPDDRLALFNGYTSGQSVSDAFQAVWLNLMIIADLSAISANAVWLEEAKKDLSDIVNNCLVLPGKLK